MNVTSDRRLAEWALGPSVGAASVVSVLTFLAVAAAFLNGIPLFVQIPIAFSVLAVGGHAVRRLLYPAANALKIDGQNIRFRLDDGSSASGTLIGTPFVSPAFVGIRWSPESGRLPRTLGIFSGQMTAADYRRLCATLRQQGEW